MTLRCSGNSALLVERVLRFLSTVLPDQLPSHQTYHCQYQCPGAGDVNPSPTLMILKTGSCDFAIFFSFLFLALGILLHVMRSVRIVEIILTGELFFVEKSRKSKESRKKVERKLKESQRQCGFMLASVDGASTSIAAGSIMEGKKEQSEAVSCGCGQRLGIHLTLVFAEQKSALTRMEEAT
jgi:hypothetical protein